MRKHFCGKFEKKLKRFQFLTLAASGYPALPGLSDYPGANCDQDLRLHDFLQVSKTRPVALGTQYCPYQESSFQFEPQFHFGTVLIAQFSHL